MPIMTIPRHEPIPCAAMAERIEDWLDQVPIRECRRFDLKSPVRKLGPGRLTLVPYLNWCLSGSLEVYREDPNSDRAVRTVAGAGDALVFAPESYAATDYPSECRFFRLTVEDDGLFLGIEWAHPAVSATGHLAATWIPGSLRQPATGLLERLLDPAPFLPLRRRALMETFLWELVDRLKEEGSTGVGPGDFAQTALRYVQDQCRRPINRELTARALEVSPGYLGRVVRSATGRSFQQLLTDHRMQHARRLLAQQRLSVEEVALQCGFTSGNYFAQAFRKAEGCSPREWRERQQPVYEQGQYQKHA
jgi:AraC-like DNA-binding protein